MKTPEKIRSGLLCCVRPGINGCKECPYNDDESCAWRVKSDALTRIEQLEEQISLMKIQMHGDCGVCKHRTGFDMDMARMSMRCYECMAKESRPNWEYEGLPEVKSR